MKTMKFLTYATFVLFLGFAVSSCSGDDGADGATGPAGADGADGADGNANVVSSDWFSVDWSTATGTFASYDHDTTDITTDDVHSSAILVYVRYTFDSTLIYQLPMDLGTGLIQYRVEPGTVRLWVSNETSVTFTEADGRYVIIKSSNSGRAADPQQAVYNELAAANVDVNDYYAVCAYYGINPQ